ncbi:hypothetical protein FYK55_25960 [Roseiconus nitratireducens]|uniref:4-hydroxybenzoate polyprenyltransferase n=1 Tax=Roseiconus nitratireducens TaxID=2605748 RepID=A0A5M6D1A2_9BACT|nr:hypothetical protein [Roseiconus nitratireducens]KAA5538885.1 hypothetical protein FYK55_25960 [Roseiconus nitratireducens]
MSSILLETTERPRSLVFTWLARANGLSLDAPLVALVWSSLLLHWTGGTSSGTAVNSVWPGLGPVTASEAVLALTVWLIYVADRLLDVRRLDFSAATADRHRFVRRVAVPMVAAWIVGLAIDLWMTLTLLDDATRRAGWAVVLLVVLYFVAVHRSVLKTDHPKELWVGLIFAVGTGLPAWCHGLTFAAAVATIALIALCIVNCLIVSVGQQHADDQQGDPSWLKRRTNIRRRLTPISIGIALFAAINGATGVLPVTVSAPLIGSALILASLAQQLKDTSDQTATNRVCLLADYALIAPAALTLLAAGWA